DPESPVVRFILPVVGHEDVQQRERSDVRQIAKIKHLQLYKRGLLQSVVVARNRHVAPADLTRADAGSSQVAIVARTEEHVDTAVNIVQVIVTHYMLAQSPRV